ncbi:uncharacterized protein B0I36DRAFT_369131 [Microdochium trichocladiopsis]|uniref:Secreted protein n=1 Tax=Microdochium trichocladiopsis TaxID=1682393 RepID=A0A9P8XUP5_9PEZI|nr:uncharacterized protein B0I36DRAFT_369131 [Microdochium trichocladiopsis]KAH7014142.1 hypothetical protein B0I36DRAFT_369131 [Microdochium trichocladiopsis]
MLSLKSSVAIAATLFTQLGSAVPVNDERDLTCLIPAPQNADYDDLTGLPGINLNPLPSPYKGLDYQGFSYANVLLPGLQPGVKPQTGSRYAVSNLITQLGGAPTISALYDGSIISGFDLQSLYFGCAINLAQAVAGIPVECTITVTGYRGKTNDVDTAVQACSRTFTYKPTSIFFAQSMGFSGNAAFAGCTNIQFARVTYSTPGPLSPAAAAVSVVIDDLRYATRSCPL